MKVGDLVEFMDMSSQRDSEGSRILFRSGIYGIVIGRDITRSWTTRWLDGETSSDPDWRLRVASEAEDN